MTKVTPSSRDVHEVEYHPRTYLSRVGQTLKMGTHTNFALPTFHMYTLSPRSKRMSRIRKNTGPELTVRRLIHAFGYRFPAPPRPARHSLGRCSTNGLAVQSNRPGAPLRLTGRGPIR